MMKIAKFLLFFSTVFCDEGKRAGRWKAEEETVLYWKELGKKQLLKNLGRMPNNKKAKNLIVFMGDGMGVQKRDKLFSTEKLFTGHFQDC